MTESQLVMRAIRNHAFVMNMKRVQAILVFVFLVFTFPVHALEARELKVITFNTWMLEFLGIKLAPDLLERRELIARELAKVDADVVNLVEVWQPKNADFFVSRLRARFPYCSIDRDRTNGLLILSRYPIKGRISHGCTRPIDEIVFREHTRFDEQFVAKVAIHAVMKHPSLGDVDLFSSHLGALTFKNGDYVLKHQQKVLAQARELASFIDRVSFAHSQILMIDTNRHFRHWPDGALDPTYTTFLEIGLRDSFMDANHFDARHADGLFTFDQRKNPYAADGHFGEAPSEFIDYIFVRSERLKPRQARMTFTHAYPLDGHTYFLSDHFAIESSLGIDPAAPLVTPLALAD